MAKLIAVYNIPIVLLAIALSGCSAKDSAPANASGGSGGAQTSKTAYTVKGTLQKGPFIQGSQITIQELDSTLTPTGISFVTQTTDSLGTFSMPAKLSSSFIEVIATGYYFNEVSGQLSDGPLTLRAFADLSVNSTVNVNVLTELEHNRIKALLGQPGKTFADAKAQAESEVISAFEIPASGVATFTQMDISKSGESNAILLAISAILQGKNSVALLSKFLAEVGTDIAVNGTITVPANRNEIRSNSLNLGLNDVRNNLATAYGALDASFTIPGFENYVDSSGTGTINANLPPSPTIFKYASGFLSGNGANAVIDSKNQIFTPDTNGGVIKKIDSNGIETVFVGSGPCGYGNLPSCVVVDGTGTSAGLSRPYSLVIDGSDNMFLLDYGTSNIRKITPEGVVSTTPVVLSQCLGFAMDSAGNFYCSETQSPSWTTTNIISKFTQTGVRSIFAGSSLTGFVNGVGSAASFDNPNKLGFDSVGNLYVNDLGNFAIRKISPAGEVSTLAGSGNSVLQNGIASSASFSFEDGGDMAVASDGTIYVLDMQRGTGYIRKVTADGQVSTYCGSGSLVLDQIGGCFTTGIEINGGMLASPDGSLYFGLQLTANNVIFKIVN